MSIMDKIKKPVAAEINPTIMIYGKPGTGKTTSIGRLPNTLVIDTERGSGSLTKLPNPPDVIEIGSLKDLEEVFIFLKTQKHDYKHIVIDTFTEIQKMVLNEILEAAVKKDPTRDPNKLYIADYGKATQYLRKIIRLFRSLPLTVIFTAHVREDKDEETGKILLSPSMTPSVAEDLAAYVDVILYLTVDKTGTRQVLTVPTDRIVAKHRFGKLQPLYKFENSVVDLNVLLEDMRKPIIEENKNKSKSK